MLLWGMSHDLFPKQCTTKGEHLQISVHFCCLCNLYMGCMSTYLRVLLVHHIPESCTGFKFHVQNNFKFHLWYINYLYSCSPLKLFPLISWRLKCVTNSLPHVPQSVTSWAECTSPCASSSDGEAPRTLSPALRPPLHLSIGAGVHIAWDRTTIYGYNFAWLVSFHEFKGYSC